MTHEPPAGTAIGKTLIKNDKVVVTEWSFHEEGANTGWHSHQFDYVVVPLSDGKLAITDDKGCATMVDLNMGVPYFRKKGAEHDVTNASDGPISFIEVEFLH